jgi:hypothetical protein
MEIDLLQHSKYNQEELVKNKEFLLRLVDKVTSTYEAEVNNHYNEKDITRISLKKRGRVANLFFLVDGSGEVSFTTRISPSISKMGRVAQFWRDKGDNYSVTEFNSDISVSITGITRVNFNNYLGDIVRLIEINGFTLKR